MSDNPYAHQSFGSDPVYDRPERTSALAVTGLVFSFTCCLSWLGALLGIISLFTIGGSRGRVGGKGIAVAAIIIGLLGTSVLIGAAFMARSGMDAFGSILVEPASDAMEAIEAGDYDAARQHLSVNVTDEQFEAFRSAYQSELGAYTGVPQGLMEFWGAYGPLGPQVQQYQGRPDTFPMPAEFAQGPALIVLEFDSQAMQGQQPTPGQLPRATFENILIVTPHAEIPLVDTAAGPSTPAPAPTGDADPAGDGEQPAEDVGG